MNTQASNKGTPWAAVATPLVAAAVMAAQFTLGGSLFLNLIAGAALIGSVFSAVYHAEVVAHKVGEPLGTLVLALAVTVIEAALIVSAMVTSVGGEKAALARDVEFAAIMITCNGIVGLCLLAGGIRHHEQEFQVRGATAALAVLTAVSLLTMVLPNYTTSTPGPTFSPAQLVFAAIVSLVLYCGFVFVQTVRHRDYFLPPGGGTEDSHAPAPGDKTTAVSFLLLLVALAAVVGLAKSLTPPLESKLTEWGAPKAFIGIVIAMLVLLPEGLASYRAARLNRLQTSLNLALGSALASICLTIPAVVAAAMILDKPLTLGLDAKDQVLLGLTLVLSVITLGTGRTTVLQGLVHLVVFGAFLFVALVP